MTADVSQILRPNGAMTTAEFDGICALVRAIHDDSRLSVARKESVTAELWELMRETAEAARECKFPPALPARDDFLVILERHGILTPAELAALLEMGEDS